MSVRKAEVTPGHDNDNLTTGAPTTLHLQASAHATIQLSSVHTYLILVLPTQYMRYVQLHRLHFLTASSALPTGSPTYMLLPASSPALLFLPMYVPAPSARHHTVYRFLRSEHQQRLQARMSS